MAPSPRSARRSVFGESVTVLRGSRRATVALVLAATVLSACSVQVGGGGQSSALTRYVGANGLLADPAAVVHRPSIDTTLYRLSAARLIGQKVDRWPDRSMAETLIAAAPPGKREMLKLRWASLKRSRSQVEAVLRNIAQLCGVSAAGRRSEEGDCRSLKQSGLVFLRVAEPSALPQFEKAFPDTKDPACPPRQVTVDDILATVMCGRKADENALNSAISALGRNDVYLRDGRALWTAAAVVHLAHTDASPLRDLVVHSLARSDVNGIYLDEIPAQGTLLSTWALLRLAGKNRAGLDTKALARAVRGEDTRGAADHVVLARAVLAQLHEADRPSRGGALHLTDPRGPYNPFFVLAARNAGDIDQVTLGFTKAGVSKDPSALASYILAKRIISNRVVPLNSDDMAALTSLTRNSGPDGAGSVEALLGYAALAAGGRAVGQPPRPVSCEDAKWLVSVRDVCSLRASLLWALYREFSNAKDGS